ncbi:Thiamine kinase [Mucilaginibacter gossypiicola]|uniref:Thiamine kinase n=1 Tax=Mucilaginibacter gossypiicola TaxID=551995 RepID=A0A1H8M9J4_9SPHI|nr:phosphotransferase [Mucilaginibacter gossypiicola]SEO13888.1 Thiamine kinase [Mucilaginibacter gossypiicola]
MKFSTLFPPHRKDAVEAALLDAFGTTAIDNMTTLAGGLSSAHTYQLTVDGQVYVLKLSPPNLSATNLSLAADANIAPALHYRDTVTGVSISDYIENQPIRAVFTPDKLISEIAAIVKAIHLIPSGVDGAPLFETVDSLIGQFKQSRILSGPVFDECFTNYAILKSCVVLTDSDRVFSHNDLNPNNILCDGKRIWVIDWDAAHLNDRYIDLANLANFFVHTEEQEHLFLSTYFDGDVDEYKKARFFTMRQVCRIVYAMLMFQLAAQHKPANYKHDQKMEGIDLQLFFVLMGKGEISLANYDGQLMYGKALLNTAVDQMRSVGWASSLAQFA